VIRRIERIDDDLSIEIWVPGIEIAVLEVVNRDIGQRRVAQDALECQQENRGLQHGELLSRKAALNRAPLLPVIRVKKVETGSGLSPLAAA
jgi:hypothetical protein